MAEAVFANMVKTSNLSHHFERIDSCGTAGYHEGELPDERTVAQCKLNKVPIDSTARKVRIEDFHEFTHIVGMDRQNMQNLRRIQPKGSKAILLMFGEVDDGDPIQDPYYGLSGFDSTFKQCTRYSAALLRWLGMNPTSAQL
ncbi:Low molecular weight phosphotyrosine protein phosphatase [Tilletia horrida]|uniref:Low molecular weight phosphotyrosine protein phosphatase n=1 Tax=Tilletia horrida TaxID=155126 RepID=A0AAN6GKF2_9BASI|nr:Low molecular weight phosphotyrosine protein phosphatase [Tilletia horrida]